MKRLVVTLALASLTVSAYSEDGWVSVGSTQVVAPASSDSVNSAPASYTSAPSANSGGDLLTELMLQVEQMKTEIASLRGQLEEQQAKVRKMEASQQDRYLDLDSRISALTASASTIQQQTTASSGDESDNSDSLLPAADAYRSAMQLVRGKKFSEARRAFDAFAENYSGDPLAVNAVYWAGEVSMVEGELGEAEKRFRQVADNHPEHNKAPDAAYKLAVVLDKSGKTDEARSLLRSVITKYKGKSDSTVALAEAYLDKMSGEAAAK